MGGGLRKRSRNFGARLEFVINKRIVGAPAALLKPRGLMICLVVLLLSRRHDGCGCGGVVYMAGGGRVSRQRDPPGVHGDGHFGPKDS